MKSKVKYGAFILLSLTLLVEVIPSVQVFADTEKITTQELNKDITDQQIFLPYSDNYLITEEAFQAFISLNELSPKAVLERAKQAGIDVNAIFTAEEIQTFESQSSNRKKRAGTTKIVDIRKGVKDIYLNSVIAGILKTVGVAGIVALVPGLSPLVGAITRGVIGQILDTSRGIILRYEEKDGAYRGMNGKYWAITSIRKQ